jgi:hypothetical protein
VAFVQNVLGKGETASFDAYDSQFETNNTDSYSFRGTVLLNALKSPVTFYARVSTADMSVSYFYRSDCYDQYVGGIPSASAAVSADAASALLNETVKLRLQYVLDEDGKTAVLRYLPVYTGNYIVEADTGSLVDLDDYYDDFSYMNGSKTADAAAQESMDAGGLSEAEQSTIASMDGLLSREKLDAAVRAMSELGVDSGYALSTASYSRDTDTGEVESTLMYTKKISEKSAIKDRFRRLTAICRRPACSIPSAFTNM